MLFVSLFILPLCSGLINTGFFRVNTKSVFKMNGVDDYENYLDKNNLEKLEKLFNMKNRRYSPYNKNTYKREINKITHNITDEESYNIGNVISKKMVEDINEEIMSAFREQIDEAYSTLNEDSNNDSADSRQTGKKKNGENNGFFDAMGVFRYKDPKMFLPDSARKGSDNDEFDSGSQFQIIKQSPYSFKDVGGYDAVKRELLQTSDILINYEKYRKYNVRTPKGIIFEGPPGNGKTLMAKGFCGEINVSFIPVSGSEFSEKYVGVGASRVRELFKLANDHRPCVIFIDEIDALARKRGNDMVSSNSEKDQTLNQLLINLDGFKDSNGIFVIGATNRLDLLDPALVRAGRMDKNIFIGNPDSATRRVIIDIHLTGKPLHPSVDMDYIVEMTGGFSGAQIENLLNESMLRALRENREIITFEDLEFITNRILSGWQSTESKFSDDIIDRIVIHEMGHALVGYFSKEHPKLVKVCLNTWSPKTPGYTVFDNNDENMNIYTKNGLFAHLMVLLSGRIAEEVFYGYSVTTGARKDFEEAYNLAQSMIVKYGMGKKNIYPDSSDQSKYLIDQEVSELILEAQEKALKIITGTKELILDCKVILKETNLLKPEDIAMIINNKYPEFQMI